MASTPPPSEPSDPVSYPRDAGIAPSQDEKTHSMLAWFLGPFIPIVPLVVFLISSDKPFAKRHAAMSLGLQVIVIVLSIVTFITCFIPIILGVAGLVLSIMGGMAANKGDTYDVPGIGKMIANIFKV